jgi:signal transduction histidine kinase
VTVTAAPTSSQRTRRLAIGLSVVSLAVFGSAWLGGREVVAAPSGWVMAAVIAAFSLVGSRQMRLYFSQHRAAFTLTDAVFMTALFVVSPAWLGLAAGAGELLFGAFYRTSAIKAVFNASNHAATAVVAGWVFLQLGDGRQTGPESWLPAVLAVMCWTVLNALSTVAVVASAEGERFERTFRRFASTAAATTGLAAPVGLLAIELLRSGPVYLLLLMPVAAGVIIDSQYAARQRDEHLRVERLYETTARTAQLADGFDVVSAIAEESRSLVTATGAICLLREGAGPWQGRTARPAGVGAVRTSDVATMLEYAAESYGSTLACAVPAQFRALAPSADVMMVARAPQGAPVDLVLAVFRERSGGRRVESGVGETLAAFAAHGAVIAANTSLVSELKTSLAAQLRANQRKDEFVATISHELRTPLTVMLGAAQTLGRLEGRISDEDRRRLLSTAVDQGQRLKLLIEDLLLVAATDKEDRTCELVPVATGQLVEDLGQDVPDGHRDLVSFQNEEDDGTEVLTDRFKVRQVIGNLVQNSLKYAPGSPIEVSVRDAGPAVVVSVVDHGPGIPAEDRERVFDRFLQLDQSSTRSQGGTGLGLYICRKLAGQLQARLELSETEGGGCTFVLTLPRRPLRRSGDTPGTGAGLSSSPPAGMLRRPVLAGSSQP